MGLGSERVGEGFTVEGRGGSGVFAVVNIMFSDKLG